MSDVADVVDRGASKHFTRRIEALGRWFDGYIKATGDETFVIAFINVTDRIEALAALGENESRLRLILQGARDYAIVTFDEDEKITSWLGGAEDVFGYSEAEMVGRPFSEFFRTVDREKGIPETEIGNARRDGVSLVRRWFIRKDGSPVFLDGTIRPLPTDRAGKPAGFIKVARNATPEKLSEDRQFALLELGDKIRELNSVEDVAFSAATIMARHLLVD